MARIVVSSTAVSHDLTNTGRRIPRAYLGRPTDSVVVEANRHLIDPIEDADPSMVRPRVLVTCSLGATNLLDLRSANNGMLAGIDKDTIQSDTRTASPHTGIG